MTPLCYAARCQRTWTGGEISEAKAKSALPQGALTHALDSVSGIAASPPPAVVVTGLEEESVAIATHFWVDERTTHPDDVKGEFINAAQRVLEQARMDGKDKAK